MNWKYADQTNTVVYRINADGSTESCLVEVISDWINEGNTPLPADLPDHNETIRAQIRAIEDQTGVSGPVRQALLAMAVFVANQTAAQMTAAGTPVTPDQLLSQNIQYQATLAVDNQVKALEAQLT